MKKLYTSFSLLLAALVLSATAQAQLVSGNLFLKGRYVEAGVQPNGSFGSSVDAPAGYHPHNTSPVSYCFVYSDNYLGYVSDHNMDGWTVGEPAYDGDYFTPGTPWEGWAVSVDGGPTVKQYSTDCPAYDSSYLLGSFVSYNEVGSTKYGIWKGMLDSIEITKRIVLDTNALFFHTVVTFTNLSSVPHNDIYYIRTVDPDNAQTWTGLFTTYNRIVYQRPNPYNATVVSATAPTSAWSSDSCSVSLGTADTNARCLIYQGWPLSDTNRLADIYNGTCPVINPIYTIDTTILEDFAIGIVFYIDHLAPVDSASDSVGRTTAHPANSRTFTYFNSFSKSATKSAFQQLFNVSIPDSSAAITAFNNKHQVTAHPNPSKTFVTVNGLSKGDKVSCLDLTGRSVGEEIIADADGQKQYNLQNLQAGFYLLVITDKQGNIISRIRVEKQ